LSGQGENDKRGRGRRTANPGFTALLLLLASGIGFLAGLSENVVKIVENVGKLFGFEAVTISLPAATMTLKSPLAGDPGSSLPVLFTVVVTGHRNDIQCDGEAEGQGSAGEQIKLASKSEAGSSIKIDPGRQRKLVVLQGLIPKALKFTLLNFRLSCGNLGRTDWVPVDVIVEKSEVVQVAPAQPTRPRKTYRVCAGNGGGESCAGGADAYFTCDQYTSIGGGAQVTYDLLAKRFCEYKDGDKAVLAPNQVIHNFSRGGGQCGWTGFTVICNP